MSMLNDNAFIRFIFKFFFVFGLCYLGSLAVIGLSEEGNYYNAFIDRNLDFISWIRRSLLFGSKMFLKIFGIETYYVNEYVLRKVNGRGVTLVYGCIGYGVMSFWIAFVAASSKRWQQMIIWLIIGLFVIWVLNITRISLMLVATNNKWQFPFGWDHHTWFNIVVYVAIFFLMYFFERSSRKRITHNKN